MTKPLSRPGARPALVDPPDRLDDDYPMRYALWVREAKEDLHYCLDHLDLGIGISNWSIAS